MFPISFLDLKKEQAVYTEDLQNAFQSILQKTNYINGEEVSAFEKNLAAKFNSPFVLACGNGTDAIYLALLALNLPKGSEVLTPSFTYAATAEPISQLGLMPVFVDVEENSFTLQISDLESKITSNSKALIVVHLFGQAVDMASVLKLAEKHNLFVIEDNAQSLGSKVKIKQEWFYTGTVGHIGTNSFFPSKNLGGFGDGGAIFFKDEAHYKMAKIFASHGQTQKYVHEFTGINSRLDTLQAALLAVKLVHLDSVLEKRKQHAAFYLEQLKAVQHIELPEIPDFSDHSFNQFTIRIKNNRRDEFQQFLTSKGIPTMVYYKIPLHLQKAFSEIETPVLKNTEKISNEVISIPVQPCLTVEQLDYIVLVIKSFNFQ